MSTMQSEITGAVLQSERTGSVRKRRKTKTKKKIHTYICVCRKTKTTKKIHSVQSKKNKKINKENTPADVHVYI
jgi:hypothetical protein